MWLFKKNAVKIKSLLVLLLMISWVLNKWSFWSNRMWLADSKLPFVHFHYFCLDKILKSITVALDNQYQHIYLQIHEAFHRIEHRRWDRAWIHILESIHTISTSGGMLTEHGQLGKRLPAVHPPGRSPELAQSLNPQSLCPSLWIRVHIIICAGLSQAHISNIPPPSV